MLLIKDIRTKLNIDFLKLNKKQIKVYCCGPTLYRRAHIGNFRTALFASFLVKLMMYHGIEVDLVSNITDIGHEDDNEEDKVLSQAHKEKVNYYNLVSKYAKMYFEDMHTLEISPSVSMPISSFISTQYKFVRSISNTYIDIDDKGIKVKQSIIDSIKDHLIYGGSRLHSFYIWKYKKLKLLDFEHEGLPGWHTGCFALVDHIFSNNNSDDYTIDLHIGGKDLADIHFNAEIVQHYIKYGNCNLSRCWMYIGNVTYNNKKISKSKDNCVYINEVLEGRNASIIKMLLCSALNESDVDINDSNLLYFSGVYNAIINKVCSFLIKSHINNVYAEDFIMRAFFSLTTDKLSVTVDMNSILKQLISLSISTFEDLQTMIMLDDLLCTGIIKSLLINFRASMKYWYLGAKHVHVRNKQMYDIADDIRIQLISHNVVMLTYENMFLLYEKI